MLSEDAAGDTVVALPDAKGLGGASLFGEDETLFGNLQLIKHNESVRSLDLNDRNATPPLKWNCLLKCKK